MVTIDGQKVQVDAGTTILEAARKVGIDIPVLCHHPDLEVQAVCHYGGGRFCLASRKSRLSIA